MRHKPVFVLGKILKNQFITIKISRINVMVPRVPNLPASRFNKRS